MTAPDLPRSLAAEALGTALLVCTVVGSGIMATGLTDDRGMALLGNTLPTGAMLFVLITLFGPVSGAQFNPAVTMVFALRGQMPPQRAVAYVAAQVAGGAAGTVAAHAMFGLPLVQTGIAIRTGAGQWLAEGIATFGLALAILGALAVRRQAMAQIVALYITAAYWFTSSTSFANPAVALARSLTASFSGIRPLDLPGFILAELVGAILALALGRWLFAERAAA